MIVLPIMMQDSRIYIIIASFHISGRGEVIREGLSSPWIPDGWSWGGMASDCCPVWIELTPGSVGAKTDVKHDANKLLDETDETWQDCE